MIYISTEQTIRFTGRRDFRGDSFAYWIRSITGSPFSIFSLLGGLDCWKALCLNKICTFVSQYLSLCYVLKSSFRLYLALMSPHFLALRLRILSIFDIQIYNSTFCSIPSQQSEALSTPLPAVEFVSCMLIAYYQHLTQFIGSAPHQSQHFSPSQNYHPLIILQMICLFVYCLFFLKEQNFTRCDLVLIYIFLPVFHVQNNAETQQVLD